MPVRVLSRAVAATVAALALSVPMAASGLAAPAVDPAPKAKDCTLSKVLDTWVSGRTVPCDTRHSGLTVWVTTWPSTTSPSAANKLKPGSGREKRFSAELGPARDTCRAKVAAYVGAERSGFNLASRLSEDVSGPNAEQWKRGERWLRCDVVVPMRESASRVALQDLRTVGSVKGLYTDVLNVLELPVASWGAWTCMISGEWREFVTCTSSSPDLLLALVSFDGGDIGWRGSTKATTDAAGKYCAHLIVRTKTPNVDTYRWAWSREVTEDTLDDVVFTCLVPHVGGR